MTTKLVLTTSPEVDTSRDHDRLAGVMLGTAVGDALGLPLEGLSARRAGRLFPGPLRHRLVLGRGMTSDDTEHTCMTAQAILRSGGDVQIFRRSLAWRLRGWLMGVPAGVGLATLRSILRLWVGVSPTRSGVHSAGNGPAMRAAIIGARFAEHPDHRRDFVEASTLLTHRDPRALRGALLIAHAAAIGLRSTDARVDIDRFLADAMDIAGDDHELLRILAQLSEHLAQGCAAEAFAGAIGCPAGVVGGYIYHTVPVCLFCWLRAPADFRAAVSEVIALGGDTDTTGAIVGGLVGATAGEGAIPAEWIDGLLEFPRSPRWMRQLAAAEGRPIPLLWPAILPRNLLFLMIVLAHGVRRAFPP